MKFSKKLLNKEQRAHYKEFGIIPPEFLSADATVQATEDVSKITVLCVRFGDKYGIEYVERLRNMVSRHMTLPYEIVCLTDDPTPITGVRLILQAPAGYAKLWWHKVHMFDASLPVVGRILYFDLDIIICNNIDKLVQNVGRSFMGIQDFNRKFHPNWQALNSSVMSWEHREHSYIWEKFCENKAGAQRLHGDQDWIWQVAKNRIKFWKPEWIQSYKWEIRNREELHVRNGQRGFKTVRDPAIPQGCSVVVFHGDPKPEDIKDPFVVDNWL